MEDNNTNNNDPFFNVEPLHGSSNNNVQDETNVENSNFNAANNVEGDPFSNVEPLQKRTETSDANNQNTDYLNDTIPEANKTINGKKFATGSSVFSTYGIILFALSLLSGFLTTEDVSVLDILSGKNLTGLFVGMGFKIAIFVIAITVISVFISFVKKYTNENGLSTFKKFNYIYFGIWGGYNLFTRISAYLEMARSIKKIESTYLSQSVNSFISGIKTGLILNIIIVVGGMAAAMFIANLIVEKMFTIKDEKQV